MRELTAAAKITFASDEAAVKSIDRRSGELSAAIHKQYVEAEREAVAGAAPPRVIELFTWPEFMWLLHTIRCAEFSMMTLGLPPDEDPWDGVRPSVGALLTAGEVASTDREAQDDLAQILEGTSLLDDCVAATGRRIGAALREDLGQEIKAAVVAGVKFDTPRRRRGRGAGRPRSPAWALRSLPNQWKAPKSVVEGPGGKGRLPRSVATDVPAPQDVRDDGDDFFDAMDATGAIEEIQRLAAMPGVHHAERALMLEFARVGGPPEIRELARRSGVPRSTLSRRWPRARVRLARVPGAAALLAR